MEGLAITKGMTINMNGRLRGGTGAKGSGKMLSDTGGGKGKGKTNSDPRVKDDPWKTAARQQLGGISGSNLSEAAPREASQNDQGDPKPRRAKWETESDAQGVQLVKRGSLLLPPWHREKRQVQLNQLR